jgi:uroporphyrinogen decarboxylase
MGLDKIVWVFMDYRAGAGERAGAQSGAGAESGGGRTMWGVPLRGIQTGDSYYAEFGAAPLAAFETAASLDDYPHWPAADQFDFDGAVEKAEAASREFAVIGPWVSHFEIYCQMRGLEQAMVDLALDPDYVDAVLDRIESIQTEMMKRFFARARGSLDLVFISDDIAGQTSLIMSPDMWRRHLQPRLRR